MNFHFFQLTFRVQGVVTALHGCILSSLTAYILSADPACGIVKDASHSLPWQRHTSITAVNVGTELCKI